MRLYSFTNSYLSSLQRGLKTVHVVAELFRKYPQGYNSSSLGLYDWAINYKTIIIKNGGNNVNMEAIEGMLKDPRNQHPWASFREDSSSLDGLLTAVAVVLPPRLQGNYYENLTDWERLFRIDYLDAARLAV